MLVIKLLLTPALIGVISMVGRRWGPAVGGWFVGLPLMSGPIVLFLALDQGPSFGARAAQGTLLGLISVAIFCLAYSWLALHSSWVGSLLGSWSAFFAATFILEQFAVPLVVAFVGVVAFLAIALKLLPPFHGQPTVASPPQWEMLLRMVTATAFVLALTAASGLLGPQLSGLLAPFPIYAATLSAFTHRFQGAAAVCSLLRGVIIGNFTVTVFFLIIATTIEREGIAVAFGAAVFAALLLHGCSLWLLRKYLDGH